MIEFKNVGKTYKDKAVLKNINLKINKGELVVLIGPSGCGKTTSLKMINRLIEPASGEIFVDGKNILKENVIELRRGIGYVIQQTGLFPHMTIEENISIVPKLKNWGEEKIKERTIELLKMVGMKPEEYIGRYPSELSGGQQQRIGVARAFAVNPEIILMDEPFSALDPITRAQLQEELFNLQQELKKTIVFVTHDMDEALKLADRICIMKDGQVLQFDTPENILRNPKLGFVEEFIGKNRIWSQPEFIKAKDIMISDPVKTLDNRNIFQAIEIMRSNKVDSLLIVDKEQKLSGIVTSGDLRKEQDKNTKLSVIMERNVITANEEASIIDVLKTMNEEGYGYIPVIDDRGVLKGLITRSSLLMVISTQFIGEREVI